MTGALIILGATMLIGLLLWLLDRRKHPDGQSSEEVVTTTPSAEEAEECCGQHLVCEKSSLAVLTTDVEYFDDEELDIFRGRPAQDYTAEETDRFTDILLTMKQEEVPAWARSLQLRGIEPPQAVRDQILMIVREMR